jgi:integrase
MARESNRLSALKVARLRKRGRYADGGGLYLQIGETGSKAWLLRFMLRGRARAMGLGPLDLITLAEARERAREARRALLSGVDPIEARKGQRAQQRLDEALSIDFQNCAERYIAAHESTWKSTKHAAQWKSSLATYAYPVIGTLAIAAIDTTLVLRVIEPIWGTKTETASRLRGRIESILDWATVRGYRQGDNPARYKGHLAKLLPSKSAIAKVKHHPAMPHVELPAFMAELRNHVGVAARAMEFLILTASRTSEVTGATWNEINLENQTWIVPANRMKAGKEHRVPLSDRAIEILKVIPSVTDKQYIFIGARAGTHISSTAMLNLIHQLRPGYVPHGFRSSFRDWAAEQTNFQSQTIEMALAHTVGNKVEAAYRRSDLFDKRRELMNNWAQYCQ